MNQDNNTQDLELHVMHMTEIRKLRGRIEELEERNKKLMELLEKEVRKNGRIEAINAGTITEAYIQSEVEEAWQQYQKQNGL